MCITAAPPEIFQFVLSDISVYIDIGAGRCSLKEFHGSIAVSRGVILINDDGGQPVIPGAEQPHISFLSSFFINALPYYWQEKDFKNQFGVTSGRDTMAAGQSTVRRTIFHQWQTTFAGFSPEESLSPPMRSPFRC